MSSGFVTETELAEAKRVRQAEWEKVRSAEDPEEAPEPVVDHRSLYDRLKEQKDKKDLEYEETHKLKNMIRGLDDDEVQFLDLVDRNRLELEKQQKLEEMKELRDFREKSTTLQSTIDLKEILKSDLNGSKTKSTPIMVRPSQKSIMSGIVKKRSVAVDANEGPQKKVKLATAGVSVTAILPKATEASANSLNCVAILPGIGSYKDTSDSDDSSDAAEPPVGIYDLTGRRIVKRSECDDE